jgi:hypothetical protein
MPRHARVDNPGPPAYPVPEMAPASAGDDPGRQQNALRGRPRGVKKASRSPGGCRAFFWCLHEGSLMPKHPVHEQLVVCLGLRLTVTDHALLVAYAEARGLRPQDALREIVRAAVRGEHAPVRPGRRLRKPTPA